MTFEESQQVYAEILFVSQYLGIRRVLENNIVGFTDKCRSLHLEFMLNDFVDEGLLEFFYSQIFSTSRCLISKLIRWKVCHFMIGKEVNLCKIINSIRNTIGTFLSYDYPLLPTTICIIFDSRQKLLDITTSPGVYPKYRWFFTIQKHFHHMLIGNLNIINKFQQIRLYFVNYLYQESTVWLFL
jgi:hypothetical protein